MDTPRQHNLRPLLIAAALLTAASALSGCRKPVFSSNESRSQFDRFDTSRDEHSEPYLEDEYGRKIVNLRGRLIR